MRPSTPPSLPRTAFAVFAVALAACGGDTVDDATFEKKTVQAMHDSVSGDLATLVKAAEALQAAAPTPTGRGWDPTLDAADLQKMKTAWVDARVAYEHVEGALAPIFPDIDTSLDARYDDFLTDSGPDADLFDAEGVTGLHAAERIMFSDVTPASVIALEKSLPGYVPARFPASEAEAKELKEQLLVKIVTDAKTLQSQWTPARIDLPGAYTGLVDLMNEQREKVNKAGNQEEESRYSQKTMADMRANLAGTRKIYQVFKPWLATKKSSNGQLDGPKQDEAIEAGFAGLQAIYDSIPGDAFPAPPPTWSAEHPSEDDLATPFGKLYTAVSQAVDPNRAGSLAQSMEGAGKILGLSQ